MRRVTITILTVTIAVFGAMSANAAKAFNAALWPSVQIFPESENITGLRLNIYGRNANVRGVDLGIAHETTGDFTGLGIGIFEETKGNASGVHLSGGISLVDQDAVGAQLTFIYSRVLGDMSGVQGGFVSYCGGKFVGWQGGAVSLANGDMSGLATGIYTGVKGKATGVQIGVVNRAASIKGLQLGFVNIADDAYGIQIGLWNHISSKATLPGFPIANFQF